MRPMLLCSLLVGCQLGSPEPEKTPAAALPAPEAPDAGEGARTQQDLTILTGASRKQEEALSEGISGLIGAKGVQIGSGGLGSRGSSLGGGGTAAGLGGLGVARFGSSGGLRQPSLPNAHPAPEPVRNQMTSTSTDALSTFAADVDTASWGWCEGMIRRHRMPRPGEVRIEEFLNAFPYTDAEPTDGSPFAVHTEVAPHPFVQGHHLMRVGVQGERPVHDRAPLRLTFLVDVSGSMSGQPLDSAKAFLHVLTDALGPEDSVAIATYAGHTAKVLDITSSLRRQHIHAAIDRLGTHGGTAMSSGVELAYDLASQAYLAGAENRVVVVSDGDANIGPVSHEGILERIEEHAGKGITLTTLGVGSRRYNGHLMEQLANAGDGDSHYIADERAAERLAAQIDEGMVTIARDVKLQVEFDPDDVLAWRLVGYENRDVADEDFDNDAVDGGEIGAGHHVTVLYELVLADEVDDALATVHVRAKPPGPDAPSVHRETAVLARDMAPSVADAGVDIRRAHAIATFAAKLRQDPQVAEVSWETIIGLLQVEAEREPQLLDLVDSARRAAELRPR